MLLLVHVKLNTFIPKQTQFCYEMRSFYVYLLFGIFFVFVVQVSLDALECHTIFENIYVTVVLHNNLPLLLQKIIFDSATFQKIKEHYR